MSKPAGSSHHDFSPFFPASASIEKRRADEGKECGHKADADGDADGDSDCAGEGDD